MPADRPRNGRVQRGNPDYFLMVRYGRLHELFDSAVGLTALDRLVIYELFDLIDYVTDATTGTLGSLAALMGISRKALGVSMARLQALGWVECHFPKGHDGEVRVLITDAVVAFSARAQAQRERFHKSQLTHTKGRIDACGWQIDASEQGFPAVPSALRKEVSGLAADATRATEWEDEEPFDTDLCVNCRDAAQFEDDDGRLYCGACRP